MKSRVSAISTKFESLRSILFGQPTEECRWLGPWEEKLSILCFESTNVDTTGHDWHHTRRVRNLCLEIGKTEEFDLDVLAATSHLHDIGRCSELNGQGDHVHFSLKATPSLLRRAGFPGTKIEQVLECIAQHEVYDQEQSKRISHDLNESHAFRDADRLDAIGAVGLARCFTFGGAHGRPVWTDGDITPWKHGVISKSSVHHIFEKLAALPQQMYTETGKALAIDRQEFVLLFLKQFIKEFSYFSRAND